MIDCGTMFGWSFFFTSVLFGFSLFFSVGGLANELLLKETNSIKKYNSSSDDQPSLMDLLNDTGRLKKKIKRGLAEEKEVQTQDKLPSKKQVVRFGNMQISISERKEEGELKAVRSQKQEKKSIKTERKTKSRI